MKIGIDVGGTKCLGVAVDDDGKVVKQYRLPTPHASLGIGKLYPEEMRDFVLQRYLAGFLYIYCHICARSLVTRPCRAAVL